VDELERLVKLAGVIPVMVAGTKEQPMSGDEKAAYMRQHKIRPGSKEWFRLWFSKPHLTGEKPTC
jgi:hypothetical protein